MQKATGSNYNMQLHGSKWLKVCSDTKAIVEREVEVHVQAENLANRNAL